MSAPYGPQEATIAGADRLAEAPDAVAASEGLTSPRAAELTMGGLTTLAAALTAQERHAELAEPEPEAGR